LVRSAVIRKALGDLVEHAAALLDQADSGSSVLSHGDAHDRNILVVGGRLHLLDFGSSG
jgi:Ser/Thr protein kinase RdoA (MazF antagonist)